MFVVIIPPKSCLSPPQFVAQCRFSPKRQKAKAVVTEGPDCLTGSSLFSTFAL